MRVERGKKKELIRFFSLRNFEKVFANKMGKSKLVAINAKKSEGYWIECILTLKVN